MPRKKTNMNQVTNTTDKKESPSKIYWKKESNPAIGFSISFLIAGVEIAVGFLLFQFFCH